MELKVGTWFVSEGSSDNLFYITSVDGNRFTASAIMKYISNILFIATDKPQRENQWTKNSFGWRDAHDNKNLFIRYIFEANKIVFTELNKD